MSGGAFSPVRTLLLVLVLALLAGCGGRGQPAGGAGAAATGPTPLPPIEADDRIIADGYVVPLRSVDLSFSGSGAVAEVLVSEGDRVTPGQLLIRLNAARQAASVAQARADVQRAQAALESINAGSRSQEIEAARAAVDGAQARLDSLKTGPSPQSIAAAQANVAAAQANLRKAQTGASAQQIAAAKAELDNAEAQRRNAQSAYDRVKEQPDVAGRPESLQLEQATNQYNAAKARYDELLRGPNAADIAAARAQLDRAEAELDAARQGAGASEIAAAEAEVRGAQAQLDLLLAGPKPAEARAAEADVAAAEAALAQAEAVFAETELRAPLGASVALVDVVPGQQVSPGATVVRLADFDNWLVETRDLTELKIVGVQPGDKATVSFDAVPGLELPARVLRIKSIGQNTQGDITYTVVLVPDRADSRMRWNMTSKVVIEPGTTTGAAPQLPTPIVAAPTETPARPTATPFVLPPSATPATRNTEPPAATAPPTEPAAPSATPAGAAAAPTRSPATRRPASPSATPAAVAAPILVEPADGSALTGAVVFRWRASGPLPPGAAYEVVWWNGDEDPANARGLAKPTTGLESSVNLDVMWQSGQLRTEDVRWTVLVVKTDPYARLLQPGSENARKLTFQSPRVPEKTK